MSIRGQAMSKLKCNLPPLKVWVRKEYLYDGQRGHGELQRAVLIEAKSLPGYATLFQVLLDNGVVRDKLPLHALQHEERLTGPELPNDYLQLWNSFSYNVVASESYLSGLRCDVLMKNRSWAPGVCLFTLDWYGKDEALDRSHSEQPDEHKSAHFIELDNGQYAMQPNNRIRWYEPSFVTKPFPERPDYTVCTSFPNSEATGKWATADTDNYMYDVEDK